MAVCIQQNATLSICPTFSFPRCVHKSVLWIFLIQSSADGRCACFHILATVNSVAMNTGKQVSFQIMFFSRYVPRSGTAGSYGSSREQTYGYQWGWVGERIDQEFWMGMYTLLCLKQITNKDLLYSTGNSARYSVIA